MVGIVSTSRERRVRSFQQVSDGFLSQPGLPFADVLSAGRIARVFAKQGGWFGGQGIYNTAVTLWSFLSQVLRDGKEASCQAAVARVVTHCQQTGQVPPTSDTGDYCRARAKLPVAALRELTREVAGELEGQTPEAWLWKGKHAPLIDGFTFTMPDTPENQAEFPQHTAQKPGVGLPIARVMAVLSLATASVLDAAIGPYSGTETGESALLRTVLDRFPEMVRRDLWTTLLADNLIRTTAAGAALLHDQQPRQISFTSTCQCVLVSWMLLACGVVPPCELHRRCLELLSQIAACEVANRPGRLEPRILKRRRHGYKLMQKPRHVLRQELYKQCS